MDPYYHQVPVLPSGNPQRYSSSYADPSPAAMPYSTYSSSYGQTPAHSPGLSKGHTPHGSYYGAPSDPKSVYMAGVEHFFTWFLPFVGFIAILAGIWSVTIATVLQPDGKLEIPSYALFTFGNDHPTVILAVWTFIASILNAILAWCFAQSITVYARHRLYGGRPFSLRGLSAFVSAKDGGFAWHPFGTKWMWLCLASWGTFLVTTTGFNIVLFPTQRTISQVITASEIDLTSPSFASFYASAIANTNDPYYDCSKWTSVRGLMLSPCPSGTGFTSTMSAARSQFETAQMGELSYLRLANITYTGWTNGVLPFTSFLPGSSNAFSSASSLSRVPHISQNTTISFNQQGIRATIACTDVSSSPIDPVTGAVACNSRTPVSTLTPSLRMKAAWCDSTTSPGTYIMYMRFLGSYIHVENGVPRNENITCTIRPVAGVHPTAFKSMDNSTWVKPPIAGSTAGSYPAALFEHILDTAVNMMVIFGQNTVDNLFAEQIVQITTAYSNGDPGLWPVAIQRTLEGMVTYLGSWERVLAEQATQGLSGIARLQLTGTLQHDGLAYAVTWPSWLLLVPITGVCLFGLGLLVAGSRHGGRSVRFNPLDVVSHIVAASCGDLQLESSGRAGARPDDEVANSTQVSFAETVQGTWGLVRR